MVWIRLAPMCKRHEITKPTRGATRLSVPSTAFQADVFYEGGKLGLVLDATICHRDLCTRTITRSAIVAGTRTR